MKHIMFAAIFGLLIAVSSYAADRPNILIIFPDDVGWENISAMATADPAKFCPRSRFGYSAGAALRASAIVHQENTRS